MLDLLLKVNKEIENKNRNCDKLINEPPKWITLTQKGIFYKTNLVGPTIYGEQEDILIVPEMLDDF